ncbi:hypothetical protein NQ314_021108 [Rhamnusium bicolor]|uniref:Uncharacterized protein n=1 Tax=Rhamnusium bicolor TaxID=1586634 RepID=A0AAV8WJ64_9CUCU|nr:hypothetical protein NQ314_021108 [Rhamnusium bicolor]
MYEPAELPCSITQEIKSEPEFTIKAISEEPADSPEKDNKPPQTEPFRESLGDAIREALREPLIKIKPPNALQYPLEEQLLTPVAPATPKILNQDVAGFVDKEEDLEGRISPAEEPADLSNKRPENLTCVPEIDFIKEEADNVSVYSNSSDPERLEVDMSQVSYLFANFSSKIA